MTLSLHALLWLLVLLAGLLACMFWAGRMDRAAARAWRAEADDRRRRNAYTPPQRPGQHRGRMAQLLDPPLSPLDLLDDALAIAERQLTAQQAAAEVRAIEAEVDAHPELWQERVR